jgi:DNA-binding CsgD family transcriptional regulator/tetratricopeptide (TPR) repeat protein
VAPAAISRKVNVGTNRQPRSGLVGRGADLAAVRDSLDAVVVEGRGRVQMVVGEAGIGKTALLKEVTDDARSAGFHVLSTSGDQAEAGLPYAALHKLLHAVFTGQYSLPDHQQDALMGALGLAKRSVAEPYLVGVAVLSLLSRLAAQAPVLVVVDDVQWIDRASCDVMSFVGRRLAKDRVALVMSGREGENTTKSGGVFRELRLRPLNAIDSNFLLDRLATPPQGRMRAQVLAQSVGNPGTLIELAKLVATDPTVGLKWCGEPLPVAEHWAFGVDSKLAKLPKATQDLLLLASAAVGGDLWCAAEGGANVFDPELLAPGEQVGLVKVGRMGVDFADPLTRSAIYQMAPFAKRATAHRRLAAALRHEPDRQAWHLAAAAILPREQLACLLEATASRAKQRGGASAGALVMERAAELSPKQEERARRFLSAADIAASTGQADRVRELADKALACTTQPALRVMAKRWIGWSWAWTNKHGSAMSMLLSVVKDSSRSQPTLAWDALGTAAGVAYQAGSPTARRGVLHAFERLEAELCTTSTARSSGDDEVTRVWIEACLSPDQVRAEAGAALRAARSPDVRVELKAMAGGAAWVLDQLNLSLELLRDARQQLQSAEVRGYSADALAALPWALLDAGHWDEALVTAKEAYALAIAHDMSGLAVNADLVVATVCAMRGQTDDARARAGRALMTLDPTESTAMTCRARRALGLAALAEGNHLLAYVQLRRLFDDEGSPVHQHISHLVVADLAASAVGAERVEEGQELIEGAYAHLGPATSARVEKLFERAKAILVGPDQAEAHLERALAPDSDNRWPFEFAQVQLDYAQWLRRRRRISESKFILLEAMESFRRLGAEPWVQRAETELRACGFVTETAPDGLTMLTSREREIVNLASSGLTNREIGQRLFLSARTVSSHLYRTYPKLGVTSRFQLRDLLANSEVQ